MLKEKVSKLMRNKIEELQSALFTPDVSNGLSACMLQHVQTDGDNNIWFTISSPADNSNSKQKDFPCKLVFFKKGADYHIKVDGLATIIDNASVANDKIFKLSAIGKKNKKQKTVKVKIKKTFYYNAVQKSSSGIINNSFLHIVNTAFNQWVL